MNTRSIDRVLGRLLGFLQRHPIALDGCIAAIIALIGFPSWPGASLETPQHAAYGVIVIVSCSALVFRRIAPRTVLTVLGICMTIHMVMVPAGVTFTAVVVTSIAAYSTQTQLSSPYRWYFLAWVYVGLAATPLLAVVLDPSKELALGTRLLMVASSWVFITAVVLAGAIRRHRHDRIALALERLQLLESRQEVERQLAASEERALIAREVHDVLGHSLNVIAMQTEGIRYLMRNDLDQAEAALAGVAKLSRSAVDEVRSVIDVLRDGDDPAPLRPIQSITALPSLVDTHRAAGANITFRLGADLESCSDASSFAVYRIVQESLTNAIKHAPGAAILVDVRGSADGIEVTVSSTASMGAPRALSGMESSTGHGLMGMQERARALGGSLMAGPDPVTGGWRVDAHLPRSAA